MASGGPWGRETPEDCAPYPPCLRLHRKEAAELPDFILTPPSVTVVDSEKSIRFINTNTLGVSPGTVNWMGVHGSQGRVSLFLLHHLWLLLATRGWPRGRGAGRVNPPLETPGAWLQAAVGPAGGGLGSGPCSTAADQPVAWGEGLLPRLVLGASTPYVEHDVQKQPRLGVGFCSAGSWLSDPEQAPLPHHCLVPVFSTMPWG